MAVTTISAAKAKSGFIARLAKDYPAFKFEAGKQDNWSPKSSTITFNKRSSLTALHYGVLHELAHALLKHKNYQTDFELLKLESQAWELAIKVGRKYNVIINADHVQNCLDTYRDWLHKRSTCPRCGMHVLQQNSNAYHCFNCQNEWHVSSGRFVRPYRRTLTKN